MKKFFITIGLFFLLIAIGILGWLYSLDSNFEVNHKINIKANQFKAFQTLTNFNTWFYWSPRLVMDSDVKITIQGLGKEIGDKFYYSGPIAGTGYYQLNQTNPNSALHLDLITTTPIKSNASINFSLIGNDEGIEITWSMTGNMPFFQRYRKSEIEKELTNDCQRGLLMLKDYIEEGRVASQVIINGPTAYNGITFVGKKSKSATNSLSESMALTFDEVNNWLVSSNVFPDEAITVYYDVSNDSCTYTSGIRLYEKKKNFPYEGAIIDSIQTGKAIKVTFKGKYIHLNNAWSAAFSYAINNNYNIDLKKPPFEIYLNDPVFFPDPQDWVTEIYLPIKE